MQPCTLRFQTRLETCSSASVQELGEHRRLSDAIDECEATAPVCLVAEFASWTLEVAVSEVLRTPSSASSSDAASDRSGRASAWWAVVLQAAGRAAGLDDSAASQSEAIRLVSACTGFGAEAWVLKAGWCGGFGNRVEIEVQGMPS